MVEAQRPSWDKLKETMEFYIKTKTIERRDIRNQIKDLIDIGEEIRSIAQESHKLIYDPQDIIDRILEALGE